MATVYLTKSVVQLKPYALLFGNKWLYGTDTYINVWIYESYKWLAVRYFAVMAGYGCKPLRIHKERLLLREGERYEYQRIPTTFEDRAEALSLHYVARCVPNVLDTVHEIIYVWRVEPIRLA